LNVSESQGATLGIYREVKITLGRAGDLVTSWAVRTGPCSGVLQPGCSLVLKNELGEKKGRPWFWTSAWVGLLGTVAKLVASGQALVPVRNLCS
jgi:hypothetical protein